jgi:RNA polymerase sigma-70 factor (ECF subfamily)
MTAAGGQAEQDWVEAAKGGDQVAFGHLVTKHQESVFRSVYRMVRDRDEAREITQEALVRAWENLNRFRGEAPFGGWLSRIATYLALNRLRERKKFVRPQDPEQHDAVLDHAGDPGATPLDDLLNREAHEALTQAISELPDEFRVPLMLRLHEEYSYEQISETLDVPLGTVMSRLFRARERLGHRVRELLGS